MEVNLCIVNYNYIEMMHTEQNMGSNEAVWKHIALDLITDDLITYYNNNKTTPLPTKKKPTKTKQKQKHKNHKNKNKNKQTNKLANKQTHNKQK